MTTVLHTGALNGHPIRFFSSPDAERPDLPWHAFEDVPIALGLPRTLRRKMRADLIRDHGADIRQAWIGAEQIIMAPHYMAQGLIGAMVDGGYAPDRIRLEYADAAGQAFRTEADSLGLSSTQRTNRLFRAATGRMVDLPTQINTETGEIVMSASDVQKALGLSDMEMEASMDELGDAGLGATVMIDGSKLARVQ